MSSHRAKLPPLSLYVHIPWCIKKCPYCDFNSHGIGNEQVPEDVYIAAIKNDLAQSLEQAQGRKLESIFFGGGTPSLFSPTGIEAILKNIEQQIGFSDDCEITLEANPGTFEQDRFSGFRQAGINRLSIGIQSFDNEKLKALGRVHNSDEALDSVSIARRAGFDNINLDLMFGLPDQSSDQAMLDLELAIDRHPEHISWYELTIEPNTEFYNAPPTQPEHDALADISERGIELLERAGYQRYETSAFAEQGMQSRHNLNYWQFGDYIGIGAGAHGKYTDAKTGAIIRQSKTRLPKHYLERIGSYLAREDAVQSEDILGEYMMNALRLVEGVSITQASERTGIALEDISSACRIACERGLMEISDNYLRPTSQGQRLLNLCLQSFL